MNTRKNRIICYTGVNARKNFKHTPKNFKNITRKVYTKKECAKMKKKYKKYKVGVVCPKRNDTNAWVKFMGANYTTPEECNAIV